jgi:L-fucose dehydrogenase
MNLGLTDKIIIVTGGAKGIGKGIVEVLAKEGAVPVIVGRSEADNNVTVREIEGNRWKSFCCYSRIIEPCRMRKGCSRSSQQVWEDRRAGEQRGC